MPRAHGTSCITMPRVPRPITSGLAGRPSRCKCPRLLFSAPPSFRNSSNLISKLCQGEATRLLPVFVERPILSADSVQRRSTAKRGSLPELSGCTYIQEWQNDCVTISFFPTGARFMCHRWLLCIMLVSSLAFESQALAQQDQSGGES